LPEGVAWFSDAARRYNICDDDKLCDVALRLTSYPFKLGTAYGEDAPALVRSVMGKPGLLRGARFVSLLAIISDPERPVLPLPRWSW
jgi:hypothetical protein